MNKNKLKKTIDILEVNPQAYFSLTDDYKAHPEVAHMLLEKEPRYLKAVPPSLRTAEFVIKAIEKNFVVFGYLSEGQRLQPHYMGAFMRTVRHADSRSGVQAILSGLNVALNQTWTSLWEIWSPTTRQDKDFLRMMHGHMGTIFNHQNTMCNECKPLEMNHDREFLKELVELDYHVFHHLKPVFKDDMEFLQIAMKTSEGRFLYGMPKEKLFDLAFLAPLDAVHPIPHYILPKVVKQQIGDVRLSTYVRTLEFKTTMESRLNAKDDEHALRIKL